MSISQGKKLKIVFGSMTFGKPNTQGARVHSVDEAAKIVDIFQRYGHHEIDSARIYGGGSTEEMLSEIGWQKRGLIMDTKLYPNAVGIKLYPGDKPKNNVAHYTHTPQDIRRGLMDSLKALKALKCVKVDMFYLHGPDRTHPFEDALREVNALHKEGHFTRFGISNYMSWEVAQMCEICQRNNWIMPSVYQGIYSALHRSIEPELVPCLRHYRIALYAFQPLAGGFLTGRYQRSTNDFEPGSRFDPKIAHSALHRGRYWNEVYFDALDGIRAAADRHGFTVAEAALRWVQFHSSMRAELGDALIVGASSGKHLEENLADLEKGPLPEDVVEALEAAWLRVKGVAPKYWH